MKLIMPNIGRVTSKKDKEVCKPITGLVPPPFCNDTDMSKKDRKAHESFMRKELPPAAIAEEKFKSLWKVPVYVSLDPDAPPPPAPTSAYIIPPKPDIPTCEVSSIPQRKLVVAIGAKGEEDIKYLREQKEGVVVEELFSRLLTIYDVAKDRFDLLERKEDAFLMDTEHAKKNYYPLMREAERLIDFSDIISEYSVAHRELMCRDEISKIIKESFPTIHQLNDVIKTYTEDDVTHYDILSKLDDFLYFSWQKIETVVDRQLIEYSTSIGQKEWFIPEAKPDDFSNVKRIAPVTPSRPKTAPRIGTFVEARTPGITRPATISRAKQTTPRTTGSPKKFVKAVTPRI